MKNIIDKIKRSQTAKIAGVLIGGIIVLSFISNFLDLSFPQFFDRMERSTSNDGLYDSLKGYDMEYGVGSSASTPELSLRNTEGMVPPIEEPTVPGNDAEDYEVTEYQASIETRHLDKVCETIRALKAKGYIIFEYATEYDRGCNYTFKVEREHAAEVLALIEEMDPTELSENTYTIKKIVTDYTSEIEILEAKLTVINETLEDAIESYDDITRLATQTQDAESLAKIIDSKIGIIERLSQKRVDVSAQLERLERAKAEQLDRLAYTYFYLTVRENTFVNGDDIADSWKAAVKEFVRDMNTTLQDITINLISFIFLVFQYAIYLFIVFIIGKYGWKLVRTIWEK
jgi:hypothetical protein